MGEDPEIEARDDDANLPEMAEYQGQAPAEAIPILVNNSQEEIDRYLVAAGAKVSLLGVNVCKTDNMPVRGEG
eukprot:3231582-Alexandrium_andersonii.AAC.1